MDLERRAFYNLLRMTWLNDPSTQVEPWQVADYRNLSKENLFHQIEELGIAVDNVSFLANADLVDSPETLTDLLLEDVDLDPRQQDLAFLLIFELWRRLLPEKLSLSIFCDELDHLIYEYDTDENQDPELIQDAIANLQMILDENADQGADPKDIFELICSNCANDLRNFIYDFIAEQIEEDNFRYATELVEGFKPYLEGDIWFDLLLIRLTNIEDKEIAQTALKKLVLKAVKQKDLELNLEILAFIAREGDSGDFHKIVKNTIPLLEVEEDFQDLLALCGDYFRLLDKDKENAAVESILNDRLSINLNSQISQSDPDLQKLLSVIK